MKNMKKYSLNNKFTLGAPYCFDINGHRMQGPVRDWTK